MSAAIGGILAPDFAAMPAELRERPRWVVWKGKKVPYNATALDSKASVTDPATWSSFPQARTTFEDGGYLGVGFVLGNGIVGADLDHCVIGGQPLPAAMNLLRRIGCAHIELSPSGTGLHGYGYGADIGGWRGELEGVRVELYSRARYFTITGRPLISGPLVQMPAFEEVAREIRGEGYTEEDRGEQKRTEDFLGALTPSSVDSISIPIRTLPRREGERHGCLFEFARYIKNVRPNATWRELREFAVRWHELALPVIGTKELAVTLDDFARAFEKVRCPYGVVLHGIISGIDHTAPLPHGIDELDYGELATRLVRFCMALAAHQAPEPFFLDVRTAGTYLGVHHTYAWKLLSTLVRDGVLALTYKGAGNKASRYRFIWVSSAAPNLAA